MMLSDSIDQSFTFDASFDPSAPTPMQPQMAPLQPLRVSKMGYVWAALSVISGAVSGYHGYRRNKSIGWGIGWFALGSIFPVITPTIAIAQGFAKPKR